ncbi:hypothetical protein OQ257_00015 [Actinobacillus equuli subsp. equuli]|uniref:Uncharacterized protein n=1 Tax=Actinobacillus equuli subsp. equuli TaxID=202947 RepID=A0A9X4G2T3_ACTEU|nr:hypothetical protein [Actinobacillus equuli]MDE8033560.1 hypothetical protein [Actinobacillus equuli subsp. equuli]
MNKPRGKYISKSEDWELNHFLSKHGYRETEDNRTKLISIIDKVKDELGLKCSENLSHDQIDEYYERFPKAFSKLEKIVLSK